MHFFLIFTTFSHSRLLILLLPDFGDEDLQTWSHQWIISSVLNSLYMGNDVNNKDQHEFPSFWLFVIYINFEFFHNNSRGSLSDLSTISASAAELRHETHQPAENWNGQIKILANFLSVFPFSSKRNRRPFNRYLPTHVLAVFLTWATHQIQCNPTRNIMEYFTDFKNVNFIQLWISTNANCCWWLTKITKRETSFAPDQFETPVTSRREKRKKVKILQMRKKLFQWCHVSVTTR